MVLAKHGCLLIPRELGRIILVSKVGERSTKGRRHVMIYTGAIHLISDTGLEELDDR